MHSANIPPARPTQRGAELADEAMRLYLSEPRRARGLARQALAEARRERDAAAAALAERCLGLIAQHLDDFDTAAEHLRAAVRLARRAGDHASAAEARMNLAVILAFQGRSGSSLRWRRGGPGAGAWQPRRPPPLPR